MSRSCRQLSSKRLQNDKIVTNAMSRSCRQLSSNKWLYKDNRIDSGKRHVPLLEATFLITVLRRYIQTWQVQQTCRGVPLSAPTINVRLSANQIMWLSPCSQPIPSRKHSLVVWLLARSPALPKSRYLPDPADQTAVTPIVTANYHQTLIARWNHWTN